MSKPEKKYLLVDSDDTILFTEPMTLKDLIAKFKSDYEVVEFTLADMKIYEATLTKLKVRSDVIIEEEK